VVYSGVAIALTDEEQHEGTRGSVEASISCSSTSSLFHLEISNLYFLLLTGLVSITRWANQRE
jgi:hypothetical protein